MSSELQVNIPAGLRSPVMFKSKNAGIIDDLKQTDEERNPTVKSVLQRDIESKFKTPATRAPVLDKDTLVPKFVDPKGSKLDSMFSYADGLTEVVKSQVDDRNVQDIISANHQLRNGNFVGAQDTMGRELTPEEITRRLVTPPTLSGQYNYSYGVFGNGNSVVSELRDLDMERLLNQINSQMDNGDTINGSDITYLQQTMRARGPGVGTITKNLYYTVMSRAYGYNAVENRQLPILQQNAENENRELLPRRKRRAPEQEEMLPRKSQFEMKEREIKENGPEDNQGVMGNGIGTIKGGHIKLGKFEVDNKKLHKDHILSIRYEKSKKKVNGFPNRQVSDDFRGHLLHLTHGHGIPNNQLEPQESDYMHKLIKQSEADVDLRPLGLKGKMSDPVERLYTMLGEIDAGNTSFKLKQNIDDLLTQLEKTHHISFQLAQKIRSSYLN